MMDRSRISGELPDDIRKTIDKLVVDRCGDDPQSYMRTEDIIGYVAPGAQYRIDTDNVSSVSGDATPFAAPVETDTSPPYVRLRGSWNLNEDVDSSNANILGGLGTLTLPQTDIVIPEAPSTAPALAFYGARIFEHGDIVAFETSQNLPVTIVKIGPAYVKDYLHVEGKGGGSFIEYHDTPHFHMPLERSASGHLLLGRSDGDDYLLSAFRIPYGNAIYTPPNALHADPYLVGRYLVVYAVTENYSTVVFRSQDGRPVNPSIGQA